MSGEGKVDRRQLMAGVVASAGAALAPDTGLAQTKAKAAAGKAAESVAASIGSRGKFLSASEYVMLDELAETIIPADSHSGGARAAKVATSDSGTNAVTSPTPLRNAASTAISAAPGKSREPATIKTWP